MLGAVLGTKSLFQPFSPKNGRRWRWRGSACRTHLTDCYTIGKILLQFQTFTWQAENLSWDCFLVVYFTPQTLIFWSLFEYYSCFCFLESGFSRSVGWDNPSWFFFSLLKWSFSQNWDFLKRILTFWNDDLWEYQTTLFILLNSFLVCFILIPFLSLCKFSSCYFFHTFFLILPLFVFFQLLLIRGYWSDGKKLKNVQK